MKVSPFFKNRYVLYITVILGVTNLLGYIGMENYDAMALLVVMFLLSRYFSKNIAINICIAIFVTSIVTLNGKLHEGFKEGNKNAGRGGVGPQRKGGKVTYSTEESQWLYITDTIRKLKRLSYWMTMLDPQKEFVESAIKELEKAQEILRKKVDKE